MVAGGALLLGATVWPWFHDERDYWTQDNAKARMEASGQYHGLGCRMADAGSGEAEKLLKTDFDEAKARFKQSSASFEAAKDRYERPIRLLRWSGIVCLGLGILGYVILRGAGGNG